MSGEESEGGPTVVDPEGNNQKEKGDEGFLVPTLLPLRIKDALKTGNASDQLDEQDTVSCVPAEEATLPDPISTASPLNSSSVSYVKTSMPSSSSGSTTSKSTRPPSKPVAPLPSLSYNEPRWSATPTQAYFLTVIKNGTMVQEIPISNKPFQVFGRLPNCDVQLEHPSISRHHAILQYRPPQKTNGEGAEEEEEEEEPSATSTAVLSSSVSANPTEEGYYVYDLGSTHGTFINKTKIQMRCYYRLRVGQMVKFGGSSRLFLLEVGSGGQEDVEEAAREEIREIVEHKEMMEKRKVEQEALRRKEEKERDDMGVMWGMVMDDVVSGMEGGEDFEIDEEKEAYYKEDPKKALKKFFDREGLEFEYEVEDEGPTRDRVFTARVRLPFDTVTGEAVYAEASVKGKKKDAVLQCALNACRMLDAQDILRHSAPVHKKKEKNWVENDFYDSDEDTFLDRTGTIEKKRTRRMKKVGVVEEKADNLESLESKLVQVGADIAKVKKKLDSASQVGVADEGVDPLEAYMAHMGDHMDKGRRLHLKQQLQSLYKEQEKLKTLIKVVQPTNLPELKESEAVPEVKPESPLSKLEKSDTSIAQVVVKTKENPKRAPSVSQSVVKRRTSVPQENEETNEESLETLEVSKTKRARLIGPTMPPASKPLSEEEEEEEAQSRRDHDNQKEDEDYANWLPPERQTGDGRTHLNEKFGY